MTIRNIYPVLLAILSCTPMLAISASAEQPKEIARYQGKPVEYWLEKLKQKDSKVRAEAIYPVASFGPKTPGVVDGLIDCFRDIDPEVRAEAILRVTQFGPETPGVVDALISRLHDDDVKTCYSAMQHLGEMRHQKAVSPLIEALKDRDYEYRQHAVKALGQAGEVAVPALLEAMKTKDKEIQCALIRALDWTGVKDKRVVSALLQAMKNGDRRVREAGLEAFILRPITDGRAHTSLGAQLMPPGVIEKKPEPSWIVPEAAAENLRILHREAVPVLVELLKEKYQTPHGESRLTYGDKPAIALGAIGPLAKDAIPALQEALKEKGLNAEEQRYIKDAIEKINKK